VNDDARMADPDTEYGAAMRQVYYFGGAAAGTGLTVGLLLLFRAIGVTDLPVLIGSAGAAIVWFVVAGLAWRRAARSLG
jgi:hypothetical protein